MAINPSNAFPNQVTAPDSNYPYGGGKNVSTPTGTDGTPWNAAVVNEIFGFQQALLQAAGITPSGNAETAQNSQYLDAIRQIAGTQINTFTIPEDISTTYTVNITTPGRYLVTGVGTVSGAHKLSAVRITISSDNVQLIVSVGIDCNSLANNGLTVDSGSLGHGVNVGVINTQIYNVRRVNSFAQGEGLLLQGANDLTIAEGVTVDGAIVETGAVGTVGMAGIRVSPSSGGDLPGVVRIGAHAFYRILGETNADVDHINGVVISPYISTSVLPEANVSIADGNYRDVRGAQIVSYADATVIERCYFHRNVSAGATYELELQAGCGTIRDCQIYYGSSTRQAQNGVIYVAPAGVTTLHPQITVDNFKFLGTTTATSRFIDIGDTQASSEKYPDLLINNIRGTGHVQFIRMGGGSGFGSSRNRIVIKDCVMDQLTNQLIEVNTNQRYTELYVVDFVHGSGFKPLLNVISGNVIIMELRGRPIWSDANARVSADRLYENAVSPANPASMGQTSVALGSGSSVNLTLGMENSNGCSMFMFTSKNAAYQGLFTVVGTTVVSIYKTTNLIVNNLSPASAQISLNAPGDNSINITTGSSVPSMTVTLFSFVPSGN